MHRYCFLILTCLLISCSNIQRLSNLDNVIINKNIRVVDERPEEDFVYARGAGWTGAGFKVKLIPSPRVYLHEQLSQKIGFEFSKNTLIEIKIKQINTYNFGFFEYEFVAQIISGLKIERKNMVINKEIIAKGVYSTYNQHLPVGVKESTKRALDNLIHEVIEHLRNL